MLLACCKLVIFFVIDGTRRVRNGCCHLGTGDPLNAVRGNMSQVFLEKIIVQRSQCNIVPPKSLFPLRYVTASYWSRFDYPYHHHTYGSSTPFRRVC